MAIEARKPPMSKRTDLTEEEKLLIPAQDLNYNYPKDIKTDVGLDILENKKVLLTGHAGTGKSSLFEQIAADMGQPFLRVNMNGQTTISDFVGFWQVKGGEMVWVDGALPLAMRRGYWLNIDEIDFAEAQILSVLNPVTEKDGKLFLKEKGHEIIKPHPYFRLFATANTVGVMEQFRFLYQGANMMNRALLDRWRVYHVGYLEPEAEIEVLMRKVDGLSNQVAEWFVQMANEIRVAFEGEQVSAPFSLRALIDFAELMVRKKKNYRAEHDEVNSEEAEGTVQECIKIAILSKVSKEDAGVIQGIADRIFL
jgi:cobaltochelatase CobS